MVNAQTALAYNMSFKGSVQNDEIELIDKKLEESKAKFMDENKNNIPSYEERYHEVLGNLRIIQWGGKPPIYKAESIASSKKRYLEHIWENSPEVKELKTEKNIIQMTDKEHELFNNAKKTLDERNLVYDELDLSKMALGCTKSFIY